MLNNIATFVQQNKLLLILICVLGFSLCVFVLAGRKKQEIKRDSRFIVWVKRTKHRMRVLYAKFVRFVGRIPVVGDITANISYGYKCQEALTDEEAALRTGRVLLYMVVGFVAALAFGLWWFGDLIISLVTAFIVAHIIMTSLKSQPAKFLKGLNEAVEDFLLAYHKSGGNIDEAFYAVSKTRNSVSRHFMTMHEYITRAYVSNNPELVQSEYNAIAPSRHLRNLYAVIYMTYKYGDQMNDGKSALNTNLMEVQEQIGDALYQQNALINETAGERWFILIGIYALPLITKYMLEYFVFEGFEYIESFITSSTGYMVQVLCSIITLLCYLLYAQLVNRRTLEAKSKANWENKVLQNARMRKLVYKFLPIDSPKRASLQATINRSGMADSANALQIRRITLAVFLAVVATISVCINSVVNTITITNNIYLGMPRGNYERVLLTQDDVYTYIDEMNEVERGAIKYLKSYNGYWQLNSEEQLDVIKTYLRDNDLVDVYRGYEDYGFSRIQSKMSHLQKVSWLNNLVFVILLTLFGYYIPLILVKMQAFLNKDMILLDEVSDLQKSTIMLMEYSSTTPDSLLVWYSGASMMLAPQFRECLATRNYDALIKSVDYKPFIQLTTSLQMAVEGLPLKEAFSGVEQRLLTQKKEQTRIVERMLKFRTDTVSKLSLISMGAVIALYMFLPLIITMLQMFMSLGFTS